jgi:hypothetical protein
MAAVLPFASTTVIKASSSGQAEIYYGLAKAVDVSRVHCHTTTSSSEHQTADLTADATQPGGLLCLQNSTQQVTAAGALCTWLC